MYIHVFGNRKPALPPGWGKEISVSLMRDTRLDATAEPGDDAKLTVLSILCGTKVLVPEGTRLQLSGGDIFRTQAHPEPADDTTRSAAAIERQRRNPRV